MYKMKKSFTHHIMALTYILLLFLYPTLMNAWVSIPSSSCKKTNSNIHLLSRNRMKHQILNYQVDVVKRYTTINYPTNRFRRTLTSNTRIHNEQQTISNSYTSPSIDNNKWMKRGLLISSFTDGIQKSKHAQNYLKYSLLSSLKQDLLHQTSMALRESVLYSPCAGPDISLLNNLEKEWNVENESKHTQANFLKGIDWEGDMGIMEQLQNEVLLLLKSLRQVKSRGNKDGDNDKFKTNSLEINLRFLYIPTAMYALRKDSNNTPGKQRQRARADGKARRDEVTFFLEELMDFKIGEDEDFSHLKVNVNAITLDLDDGSLKQPYGFGDESKPPENGKTAFTAWKPHLIYVEGGNTFWLQHCLEKGNWAESLLEACTGSNQNDIDNESYSHQAVYIGKSAGAIIAGKFVETATWKGWDDPSIVPNKGSHLDWKGCKGMNLAGDISIFPHYTMDWSEVVSQRRNDLNDQDLNHQKKDESFLYCLKDSQVCLVHGDSHERIIVEGS